ncbi:hypothetical protein [Herbiconiux liukaitaii]|uniref:hypothetical protein n=1 Tax=Herbiconiux liukaitaii TaxID=3342799 RepID=UPI0035BB24A0
MSSHPAPPLSVSLSAELRASPPAPPSATSVEWCEQEPRLWVALVEGDAVGAVEFEHGHFVALGLDGREITSASSLPAAKAALADAVLGETAQHHRPAAVPLPYLVAVVGTVALSVMSMTLFSLV